MSKTCEYLKLNENEAKFVQIPIVGDSIMFNLPMIFVHQDQSLEKKIYMFGGNVIF